MSGSHSIDQATAGQPAVDSGFAPPTADPTPPPTTQAPPPPPSSSSFETGPDPDPAPKKTTMLPTGGVEALERPEGQVGLAFAGGFLAALILKRLVG